MAIRGSKQWKKAVSLALKQAWAEGRATGTTGQKRTLVTRRKIQQAFSKKRLAKFIVGNKLIHGQRLKGWLLIENIKQDVCEVCNLKPIWNKKPITLELDHINGNRLDNRIKNLRIICPNCHSQTDTYKWKNSKTDKAYSVSIKTRVHSSDGRAAPF